MTRSAHRPQLTELARRRDAMAAGISARLCRFALRPHVPTRPVDLHLERIAARRVARMRRAAVAARTRRERAQQIDLSEELDEVAGPHRARLHEVLMGVAREA